MFEHHYDDMLQKNYTFSDIHNLLKDKKFKQIFKKLKCHLEKHLNMYILMKVS